MTADCVPADQGSRRPQGEPRGRARHGARRSSTSTRTSRSSGVDRAGLPAGHRRCRSWPADVGLAGASSRPATAATRDFSRSRPRSRSSSPSVRRLHGLRERLPGQRDPRHRRAGARPRAADRVVRRTQPAPAVADESIGRISSARRNTPRSGQARLEPAASGSSSSPLHCKGCASASRCARRWDTTRCS
jgi:hypothetical protein